MSPDQQAQFEQNWIKSFQSGAQQPAAQLQETQAAAAAAGASAGLQSTETQTAQIKAQQSQAPQQLRTDLQKKMTLSDALSKYTSLGMSADDVFKRYLDESPYGTPGENPQDLQKLGVTAGALGKIGDPGSFMDRYNTKNAISGLRNLESAFHQTDAVSKLPFLGGATGSGRAYEAARQIFGNHLASLIPGASGAQATGQSLLSTIPDVGSLGQMGTGDASKQFKAVEDQLLQTKGYKLSDLGLSERESAPDQKTKSGGSLISTLLANAGKDITGMTTSLAANPFTGVGIAALNPEKTQAYVEENNPLTLALGIGKQYADIATNPQKAFTEHPVSSTLAVLGPILGLKAAGTAEEGVAATASGGSDAEIASTAQAAKDVFSSAPGKLQQLLNPAKSKNVIGQIRDKLINNADDMPNNTVSGDNLASGIRQWADKAKLSNLPDANTIEEAAVSAEKQYAGKTFKPSDLKGIYDNIEKGYTKGGEPRSATASYIDRGVQGVLSDQLEKVAPGFQKTSDLFSQTFKSEKSPIRGIAKAGAKSAVGYGLGIAGFDAVRHILGL